jgi:hypothetical protein
MQVQFSAPSCDLRCVWIRLEAPACTDAVLVYADRDCIRLSVANRNSARFKMACLPASSPGAVPPCYDHDGSSCSASFHVVKNSSALNITTNGSCANDTWCSLNNASISFTGTTAQFANDRYNCTISSMASYLIGPLANSETTTGFQIHAYNNSGRSIASGSDLGLTYVCFGI